jgi:hypothetical protein
LNAKFVTGKGESIYMPEIFWKSKVMIACCQSNEKEVVTKKM